MPYDLYGTYYASRQDALNAETAQCAAIDADIAMREINKLKKQIDNSNHPNPLDHELQNLWEHIKILNERVSDLENYIKVLIDTINQKHQL